MNSQVELFKEPLKIKEVLSENGAEMSELQHALLCGLIKKYRPEKIVEVGVAAGGTTAIILNCIVMLNMDTKLYSVDALEYYYRDSSKSMGYLAEECKVLLKKRVNYKKYGGGYLPNYIDEIGNNIDFLVLDTQHSLPGELLDFLTCLPYLKDGSIVVLHDIFLNHEANSTDCFATRILLSSVVGEKLVCKGDDNSVGYIGLGVFKVTKDTKKYIENVFSALMVTWKYIPDSEQIDLYRRYLSKYYSNDLMDEFNAAVKLNKNTLLRKQLADRNGLYSISKLLKRLENKKNIFIYGCGKFGRTLVNLLESFGIQIEGYVVSDNQMKPCVDKRVEYISDIDTQKSTLVLCMGIEKQREVCKEITQDSWIGVDESILSFLRNYFLS